MQRSEDAMKRTTIHEETIFVFGQRAIASETIAGGWNIKSNIVLNRQRRRRNRP